MRQMLMLMAMPMSQGESPLPREVPFVLFGPLGTDTTSALVVWSLGNYCDDAPVRRAMAAVD